jgi:hypothetical protein
MWAALSTFWRYDFGVVYLVGEESRQASIVTMFTCFLLLMQPSIVISPGQYLGDTPVSNGFTYIHLREMGIYT